MPTSQNSKSPVTVQYRLPYLLIISLLGVLLTILSVLYFVIPEKSQSKKRNNTASTTTSSPSSKKTTSAKPPKQDRPKARLGKVNINEASQSELADLVKGIGPATARRIVARRKIRPFKNIEELLELQGVSQRNFNLMKDRITVK